MTTLGVIHWNVDPTLLELGPLQIRYYGLLFALGFFFGYTITQRSFVKQGLSEKWMEKLFLYIGVATILGARLGHVFFYDWAYYSQHPGEILQIWKGGLASHGATIAILFAAWLFGKKVGKSFLWVMDEIVVPIALAGFCIRLGNFFNSEIIGTVTDVPWAVVFERIDQQPRHPAQLYEAVVYLLIFIALVKVEWFRQATGRRFGAVIAGIFIARFCIEFVKENQSAFEEGWMLNMGQLLSIPLIFLGVGMLLKRKQND